ncbi:MAG: hypothetical protein HXX16_10825 [Bacteroidales bacterium]|nr:hypothetical protein [Bacteroidales bacterium]
MKDIKEQIRTLAKEDCYKELYELFVNKQLNYSYYNDFLKLKKRSFGFALNSKFWQSKLSTLFIPEILSSINSYSIFKSFFSKNENFNEEVLNRIIHINCEQFIEQFKLNKGFKLIRFMEYLSKDTNPQIICFIRELEVICRFSLEQSHEIYKQLKQLSKFEIAKVLSTISNWQITNSENLNVNNPGFIVQLIHIVNKYFEFIEKSIHQPKFSFDEIDQGGDNVYNRNKQTIEIEASIAILYKCFENNIVIDLYCSGYMSFEYVSKLGSKLVTNKNYERYQLNDLKVKIDEIYFTLGESSRESFISNALLNKNNFFIKYCKTYFSFYGNFAALFLQKNGFDLYDTIYIIRSIIDKQDIKKEISIWRFDDFCALFESMFSKINNFRAILNYLIFDFNIGVNPNILYKPFIKIDNNICLLNGLLRRRSWNIIYLNRIIEEFESQEIGESFEKSIPPIFSQNNFSIAPKRNQITINSNESTDIDLLAHKNGLIFVIQAKFSKIVEDYDFISFIEKKRLAEDASRQMDISLVWINENWEDVCKDLKISTSIEKIEIIPLIITNYYDGDGILYNGKYPKISLLQLHAIFNNKTNLLDVISPTSHYILNKKNKIEIPESSYSDLFSDPKKLEDLWFNQPNSITPREILIF